VALKEEKDLFAAVLAPMIQNLTRNSISKLWAPIHLEDLDAVDIVPTKIIKRRDDK
jgi:hypothetical protein